MFLIYFLLNNIYVLIMKEVASYIVQYSILRIVQSALHF